MTRRLYLAGPMTGHPDLNHPAFHEAARLLREQGFEVGNPAEIPPPNASPTWEDWMRAALAMMLTCDAIALLPGWGQSRGALEEHRIAHWTLGLICLPVVDWLAGETDR